MCLCVHEREKKRDTHIEVIGEEEVVVEGEEKKRTKNQLGPNHNGIYFG